MLEIEWPLEVNVDWSGCDLVEVVPGKHSGDPLIKNTRIPADVILQYSDVGYSLAEIEENYPSASMETIKALIAYAHAQRLREVA